MSKNTQTLCAMGPVTVFVFLNNDTTRIGMRSLLRRCKSPCGGGCRSAQVTPFLSLSLCVRQKVFDAWVRHRALGTALPEGLRLRRPNCCWDVKMTCYTHLELWLEHFRDSMLLIPSRCEREPAQTFKSASRKQAGLGEGGTHTHVLGFHARRRGVPGSAAV